jgi:4-hydroxybenzoate polyprenyltransferase
VLAGFGPFGWLGLAVVAAVFVHQHRLVAQRGAAEALRAFDANLWVGSVMLAAVAADLALRSLA